MSESVPLLKLVEVLVVLAAGAGFAWWQFSDLARARRERERPSQSRVVHEGAASPHGLPAPDASPAPPEANAPSQERP